MTTHSTVSKDSSDKFNENEQFREYLDFNEERDIFKILKYKLGMEDFIPLHRLNFYVISLEVKGSKIITVPGNRITLDRPALFFSNPLTPFTVEFMEKGQEGYMCVFSSQFLQKITQNDIIFSSPLFNIKKDPIYFPTENELETLIFLFEQMKLEEASNYRYKRELLQNYVRIILHKTLKGRIASELDNPYIDVATRITNEFKEALNNQFPITSKDMKVSLRAPKSFSEYLSVHINHLNSSVQEITGKTTSQLIAEKLTFEAKILLRSTDWSIDEIAHCLGFEYVTYFHTFFRKNTDCSPSAYRKSSHFD